MFEDYEELENSKKPLPHFVTKRIEANGLYTE